MEKITQKCNRILSKTIILIIKMYQIILSPLTKNSCRFYPSCSSYAIQAIDKHGCLKGSFLISKRILCCHPWHSGGIDPVPE